jgi:hypothetical protein
MRTKGNARAATPNAPSTSQIGTGKKAPALITVVAIAQTGIQFVGRSLSAIPDTTTRMDSTHPLLADG